MNAPILLFVFNRPEHVRRTVEALQRNTLAAESILSKRSKKIHTHHQRIQGNKHH